MFVDSTGTPSRADLNGILSSRNSDLGRETRSKMLKGEWPNACIRCQTEEAAGLFSRRKIESNIWKGWMDLEKAKLVTDLDGTISHEGSPIRHIDLRFGNQCNLKCRSCNPTESSQWLEDHLELWGNHYDESTYKVEILRDDCNRISIHPNPYNWHESSFFWSEFQNIIPELRSIYFAGGEPLMIRRHYELLEICVEKGFSKNLTLEYNTNLTILPQKVLDLWSQFREVKIGVSIDGVGALNDYIRHPSRWPTFERNLDKLDRAEGNFSLWLAPTVMVYNILDLPNLMIWKLRKNFKRINNNPDCLFFSAHPLHRPQFLNIQSLLPSVKAKVESYLLASKQVIIREINSAFNEDPGLAERAEIQMNEIIGGYISFMNQRDLSHLNEKFWYFTSTLDRRRSESLSKVAPELAALMSVD